MPQEEQKISRYPSLSKSSRLTPPANSFESKTVIKSRFLKACIGCSSVKCASSINHCFGTPEGYSPMAI
jgi:hypothetical protein